MKLILLHSMTHGVILQSQEIPDIFPPKMQPRSKFRENDSIFYFLVLTR